MRFKSLVRPSWLGAILLGAAWLAAPSSGLAAGTSTTPKAAPTPLPIAGCAPACANVDSRRLTIHITDTGFDKQSYTVNTSSSQAADYKDWITIINDGTQVHTATAIPGSGYIQWSFTCFPTC